MSPATTDSTENAGTSRRGVLVVGAGISGLACAQAVSAAGLPVRVVERGRRAGGRMSGRTLHGRVVDLGASYFTVPHGSAFAEVVERWEHKGLVRPWTDSFAVLGAHREASSGPMRYAAGRGLRSLVIDLAEGLDAEFEHDVTHVADDGTAEGVQYDTVVLAMPEPQAARMLTPGSPLIERLDVEAWEPAIAVALGYDDRHWPAGLRGAFVDGSAVLAFIADDGDRRGDGAPVLVAHTTAAFAREHLERPDGAVDSVTAELSDLLGLDPSIRPQWSHAHRWTYARAGTTHPEPFAVHERLAVCGDAWGGRSSVATAWASGDALGQTIVARG